MTSGSTTASSSEEKEFTRTPVNSRLRLSAAPETMQSPDTSEERPSRAARRSSCTNLAGGVIRHRSRSASRGRRDRARAHVGQVDIGLPIGIDRADVAPVGLGSKDERTQERVKRCATALPFLTM
jgi:hypothetical protein